MLPQISYNAFVPNVILSSMFTHPMQHPHLCNIKLIFLLTFDCLTFSPIQHRQSYCIRFWYKMPALKEGENPMGHEDKRHTK